MTSSELLEKTNQLIASVKLLEKEYEHFQSDKEIGDDVEKLIEYQNEFWNGHVSRIIDEITQDESDGNINDDHCILLWNNCFLTHFYNAKIFDDWTDLELRKLTILLGIHNLEKLTKNHAIVIEPKSSYEEPKIDAEDLTSTSREMSNSPRVYDAEIGVTSSDIEPEIYDEDNSKILQEFSENSQIEINNR